MPCWWTWKHENVSMHARDIVLAAGAGRLGKGEPVLADILRFFSFFILLAAPIVLSVERPTESDRVRPFDLANISPVRRGWNREPCSEYNLLRRHFICMSNLVHVFEKFYWSRASDSPLPVG